MRWIEKELDLFAQRFSGSEMEAVPQVAGLARQGAERPHHYLVSGETD